MATYKHIRSNVDSKRPTTSLADGQIAINTNVASPGLFFKDSAGTALVKVGPVHVGTTAPNASPATGGSTGNSTGEQWLDTSLSPPELKVWNGSAWISSGGSGSSVTAGDGIDVTGSAVSVDLKANGGCVIESTELAVDLGASAITGTLAIGDGGTGATTAGAARTALGVAIGSNVQAYDADLAALSGMQTGAATALAVLTSTEVAILDGATLTTTELNYVDGVTSSIQTQLDAKQASDAELSILAGMASGTATNLAALTAAEIAILDGATLTTTELNYVDGVTSGIQTQLNGKQANDPQLTALAGMSANTATSLAALTNTEVDILDGATATTAELNILDGATLTTTELNYVNGVTSSVQTQLDAKQAFDAQLTTLAGMAATTATNLAGLTAAEVAILDGATVTTAELNHVDGVTSNVQTQLNAKQTSDAQLTTLAGMAAATADSLALLTDAEVEILDGATLTTTELNYVDGVTSNIQSQLNAKQASDAQLSTLAGMASETATSLAALTGTEVAILDGATATTTELNILVGATVTTAELNYSDGVTSNIQSQLNTKQTSDAKLTTLAGMSAGTATSLAALSSTEVAILDGATVTTGELNKLDGVTATTTELNYVDGVTSNIQTQLNGKQTSDAQLSTLAGMAAGTATNLAALTSTEVAILDGATLTTTELNYVDGVTSSIQTQLDAKQASDTQLTALAGMSASTATNLAALSGTEVAILDGAIVTTAELNILGGGTAATSTTLAAADRMVTNDGGTMVQVALSDLVTFFENGAVSGFSIDGGTF
tara:strand:- start:16918 stop:19269 length:2352 start_codon:yes stop_codon:yes gene_type:complete